MGHTGLMGLIENYIAEKNSQEKPLSRKNFLKDIVVSGVTETWK